MLRELHLIIMDKTSLIPVNALCAIDLLLHDLMNNDQSFFLERSLSLEETFAKFSQWCDVPLELPLLKDP